jgi:single-stranded-DNA-specific exonuclease
LKAGPARWSIAPEPPDAAVKELEDRLHLSREVCRLLVLRGHSSPEDAAAFLRPRLEALHDPALMMGMKAAVDRLAAAIAAGERIMIHGDYDVDGICSTTLLTAVLREFGALVTPFIPRRLEDGYDLGNAGVSAAIQNAVRVMVTCDCGTSAAVAVEQLSDAGIDVIVTDHHLPPASGVPSCLAVLNPRQRGCEYPDKDLAGVGVAFKLATQLARRLGRSEARLLAMLDIVALATIADLAPLRGENRILSRTGLRVMRESRNVGLRSLIRSSGLADKAITAGRIGFVLAPRLNAVGRLAHALRGVELLSCESEAESNVIARDFEELNRRRQDIDRQTLDSAREMLLATPELERHGIVLASENWHAGVIGIVASRMVEETGRPTILISLHDGIGKGSGRSIPAFDLHSGLSACSDILERFGGHRAAAGITVRADRVAEFAVRFDSVVRERVAPEDFIPTQRIDMVLNLATLDVAAMERMQRHFEPFGPSNAAPVYLARGVNLLGQTRRVGGDGLRFRVGQGGRSLDMLGWGMANRREELLELRAVDIVFRLEHDEWNGVDRVQGRVLDFRGA